MVNNDRDFKADRYEIFAASVNAEETKLNKFVKKRPHLTLCDHVITLTLINITFSLLFVFYLLYKSNSYFTASGMFTIWMKEEKSQSNWH